MYSEHSMRIIWFYESNQHNISSSVAFRLSFAMSNPFVISLKAKIGCIVHSLLLHLFRFRVAFMPAVRYNLSGGLPTWLWSVAMQDYSAIYIFKKLM